VCSDKIRSLAGGLPLTIAAAILAGDSVDQIVQDVINAINDILGFVMPLCDTLDPSDPTDPTPSIFAPVLAPRPRGV
jgi:hypothetical protein